VRTGLESWTGDDCGRDMKKAFDDLGVGVLPYGLKAA